MDETLQEPTQPIVVQPSWRFYPSHLTKGMVGSCMSLMFAMYAGWQFAHVGKDEYPTPPQ